MKCAFLGTKIAASFEAAKRNLLKSVKGFEKVRSKGYGPLFHSEQNSLPGPTLRSCPAGHVPAVHDNRICFVVFLFNRREKILFNITWQSLWSFS